ncbi:MAG: TldD/PmbA family protein [Candidatus Thermoplasmatota archaeon]
MAKKISTSELTEKLLKYIKSMPDVSQAEAYASKNKIAVSRIETLSYGKKKFLPSAQQFSILTDAEASIRVVVEGAIGFFSTNYFTDDELKKGVEDAVRNARIMKKDPDFRSLSKPVKWSAPTIPYDKKIHSGDVSNEIMDQVEASISILPKGIELAGSIMAVSEEFSIENTNGISVKENIDTFCVAQLTAERVDGSEVSSSGVGWDATRKIKSLNSAKAAMDAVELAKEKPVRKGVSEGKYNVIFGPYAVADIVDNMIAPAFSLDSIYLGYSWVSTTMKKNTAGKELRYPTLESKISADKLTIKNDPTIPDGMASKSYDDEGLPTKVIPLVENGIWKNVISNTYYSYLYEMPPSACGFRFGAIPGRIASCSPSVYGTNIVFEKGDMSFDELVEISRKRKYPTLYVPRTWYTYPTRYGGPTFSSSNRSNSYLITKKGMVSIKPNSFKLTGNILEILMGVYGIGKETKAATTWAASSATISPHIATRGIKVEKPIEK